MLVFLYISTPLYIEVDSSDYTIEIAFSQELKVDSKWHSVTFISKSLSPIEHNYKIHDKKILAIILALKDW